MKMSIRVSDRDRSLLESKAKKLNLSMTEVLKEALICYSDTNISLRTMACLLVENQELFNKLFEILNGNNEALNIVNQIREREEKIWQV